MNYSRYPEDLQKYLAHVQAVDTRHPSAHPRGPGNEAMGMAAPKIRNKDCVYAARQGTMAYIHVQQ